VRVDGDSPTGGTGNRILPGKVWRDFDQSHATRLLSNGAGQAKRAGLSPALMVFE